MAISRVVPVTGSGGGMTASPQGRSVHPQPTLNRLGPLPSGAKAFTEAFSPYLQMAMKRSQDLQKRKEIAGMKSAYDAGDTDAFNIGPSPRPGVGMEYEAVLAKQAQAEATMRNTAAMNKFRVENMNQRATENAELRKILLTKTETGKTSRLETTLKAKVSEYQFKAGETRKNLGTVHAHETSQLTSKNKAAFRNTEYVRESMENMQDWDNSFKAGQSGDSRVQEKAMLNLTAKHKREQEAAARSGVTNLTELKHKQKKEVNTIQNAFKAGESNKSISSTEMLAKMDDATTREISENRLKVKTDINAINNSTKRFSVAYAQDSANWRTKLTQDSTTERQSLAQIHETTLDKVGKSFEREMVDVKANIAKEKGLFDRQTETIKIELKGSIGERKTKLESELKSIEARKLHLENKEMAASNAYLKEEMGLKFRAFERKTNTDIAIINAKAKEYKARQGDVRLAGGMRKEFNAMTDDFITGLEPVYMNAHEAYRKNSPAGDKAIIFAYARYLRPDSHELRKHTVDTIQNMSGMPGFVRDLWRKVSGGKEILNPAERKDIMSRLEIFHAKHIESYQQKLEAYRQIAFDSGVPPRLIKDLSLSGGLKPYSGGEGTGATEPGVYMLDTGIPGAGIAEDVLGMVGGMHDDPTSGGGDRRKSGGGRTQSDEALSGQF